MSYRIRTATPADAASLLAIYAPYVTDTCVSFELEVPTVEEFGQRIQATLDRAAYLVAEDSDSGAIAGYAYNGSFRSRPAYDWASEISIYLAPEHQGHGLGSALLDALEELMRLQGVRMSEACITSSNTGSITFHERHGYRVRRAYRLWVQAGAMAFRHLDGKAAAAARRRTRAPAWLERRGD